MSKHHKCGREIPGGESGGHCGKCCRSFRGQQSFDMHLRRNDDGSYEHLDPAEVVDGKGNPRPYWIDKHDIWHYGKRRPAGSYGHDAEGDS